MEQLRAWVEAAMACCSDAAAQRRPSMAAMARLLQQLARSLQDQPPLIYASPA
jgi:hypothetical protein